MIDQDYHVNVGMKSGFQPKRQDGLMVKLQHCLHLEDVRFGFHITATSKKAEASTRKNAQDVWDTAFWRMPAARKLWTENYPVLILFVGAVHDSNEQIHKEPEQCFA